MDRENKDGEEIIEEIVENFQIEERNCLSKIRRWQKRTRIEKSQKCQI